MQVGTLTVSQPAFDLSELGTHAEKSSAFYTGETLSVFFPFIHRSVIF